MSPPVELNQDAFISYRHDNNQFVDENGKGWVDHFHERLELQLIELTGRKVEIWRDKRLPQNGVLVTYLRDEIKQTVALVAVLSPGYIRSDWCMGELREFCNRATENGGLHLNGRSRIFAVVKLPPDGGTYPDEIGGQLRYEFFSINRETKRPDEFSPDLGRNKDQRYWNTLATLAWDLKELLKETGRLTPPVAAGQNVLADPTPTPAKKTIYLAETTDDLAEQRRQIKEELILHGYDVLPQRPLPYVLSAYTDEVKADLAQCEASINLLGRTYGLIPDGAGDRSILRLQLELANEYATQRAGFKRLIWTPEGWDAADDKLGQMMQQVKLLADPHKGVEFLQTSLEEFKTLMHKRLTVSLNGHGPKSTAVTDAADAPAELRKVYLICDRRDVIEAKPLISYLQKERRYEVMLPEFDEDGDIPLSDLHQQYLLECDGVIVYYGHGSSRWASAKRSDIEKHAGLEKTVQSTRIRPLRAKLFYVTLPFTDLKDVFDTHTAQVIKNFGDFDPACLSDFISALESETDNEGGNDDAK